MADRKYKKMYVKRQNFFFTEKERQNLNIEIIKYVNYTLKKTVFKNHYTQLICVNHSIMNALSISYKKLSHYISDTDELERIGGN